MEQHGKCALYLVNGQTQWGENLLCRARFFPALVLHTEQKILFYHCYQLNWLLLHENPCFVFFFSLHIALMPYATTVHTIHISGMSFQN